MEFYDIHSHILAKVDDGAETFEMSCQMLDMAYEEGIRHLCVTPHYNRHNADDAERPKKVMRAFGRWNYMRRSSMKTCICTGAMK